MFSMLSQPALLKLARRAIVMLIVAVCLSSVLRAVPPEVQASFRPLILAMTFGSIVLLGYCIACMVSMLGDEFGDDNGGGGGGGGSDRPEPSDPKGGLEIDWNEFDKLREAEEAPSSVSHN